MTAQQCERIWTIHDEAAWKHFEQNGVMKGDGRRVIHDYRPTYYWIMEQMRQRIPGYGGGYPVWAWSRWKRRSPKPDPHECTRYPSGAQGVVVECEVPCDSILKSDHELWHIILSGQYLGASEEEEMEWEQRELSGNVAHDVLEQERRRSWEKIFHLTNDRGDPKWLGSADSCAVQAVIEQILLDQVRKVEWFTAR